LLANNSWYANRYFVRNAYWNSLAALDGSLFANWHADAVRNFLSMVFANPVANCVVASTGFRNHGAGAMANVLGALFANPFAGAIANGSSSALRNHLAGRVANGLLAALRNHLAGRVANCAATWFANIGANGVVAGLAVALRNHLASRIANGLLTALRNHLANRVRNCLGYAASLVTNTVDFLGFAGWNPALLAHGARWALYAFSVAGTWAVYALAGALVPSPCAWLAYNTSYDWTRDFFGTGFPMTTTNLDRLGVVDWCHYRSNDFPSSLFLNWNHHSVVNHFFVIFTNWLHHCVVDDSLTSFVHGTTNGVVDHLFVCLMNWLHHRVIYHLLVSFTHRYADRVLNFLGVCLVHRSSDIVGHLSNFCVVNRLHYSVFASPSLMDWLANRVIYGSGSCFALHASHIDYLVFGNRLPLGSRALNSLLFIDRTTYSLHYSVGCWCFTTTFSTAAAILVANSSAIASVGSTGQCSQQGYQDRYHKQPSHLPFSLVIETCV
jgi:ABC-type multidrug transport system fused ATPase/permease subunit